VTDADIDIKAIFRRGPGPGPTTTSAPPTFERACAGIAGIRARVEALLAAIGQAGSFLETPGPGPGRRAASPARARTRPRSRPDRIRRTRRPASRRTADRRRPLADHRGLPAAASALPTLFGSLRTRRGLGDFELGPAASVRGRWGFVGFEARQVRPETVPVAVKMIPRPACSPGRPTSGGFRIEAEAVAHLDHPRIVPIYGVWGNTRDLPLLQHES